MKSLYIDKEAIATLAMAKEGLFKPVTSLMNEKESKEVNKTGLYNNSIFPFSFILSPSGKKNNTILKKSKVGDKLQLVCNDEIVGSLTVNEVFKIDRDERILKIYGTNNKKHPGVNDTYKRLGKLAVSGEYTLNHTSIKDNIAKLESIIKINHAKKVSSIILSAKPFHRVHERIIRTALVKSDLVVIFLRKSYKEESLDFDIRYKIIKYFCDNFLPKDKVLLLPFENTYIFGGLNELTLNAIVSKNYGIDYLLIGQNQQGLGAYWEDNKLNSLADTLKEFDLHIEIFGQFVYCSKCTTLVNVDSCPHGSHNHVKYHNNSIMELFKLGVIPPAIFMRKEISSMILSTLYPERKELLSEIHKNLSTSTGIIDEFKTEDFYTGLINLYQTSSLT